MKIVFGKPIIVLNIKIELEYIDAFNVDGEKMEGKKFIIDLLHNMLNVYNDTDFVNDVIDNIKVR